MKAKKFSLLGLLVILSLLVTQCGATPEPQTVVQTVEVEKTVVETVEVEKEVIQTVEVEKEVEVEVTAVPEGRKPKGTLRVALTGCPNSLYTPVGADQNADNAASQLYDSLVYLTPQGDIEPALAERWEVSEHGTEYTFYLREGVTFHNGEPFTADDVVATWEWGKLEENQYSDKYAEADMVDKVDDYTVKIITEGPKPLLISTIQDFWNIIPNEYMDEVGVQGFQEHPIGTGPFMFEEWVRGDHITLKANPNYWREGFPLVETLIFRPIPESSTRVAAIQTDEIDIVTRLTPEEGESLLGAPDVKVVKFPLQRVYYIAFNNLTTGVGEPTEDPRVRQAMNYAVDVEALIDVILGGYGEPASSFISSSELGGGAVEPFGYDVDKARQLLAEAGYPDGFSMDMACPQGAYSHFEEVCEAIAAYLGEVGIDITLELMESSHYWELEAEKQLPPLFGDSWGSSGGEAYDRLMGALGGWETAYSSWSDPVIDDLLAEIGSTVDREERKALYEELQVYMIENPPFIYLYEPVTFEAINTRVQNYHPLGGEDYWLFDTWVAVEE